MADNTEFWTKKMQYQRRTEQIYFLIIMELITKKIESYINNICFDVHI